MELAKRWMPGLAAAALAALAALVLALAVAPGRALADASDGNIDVYVGDSPKLLDISARTGYEGGDAQYIAYIDPDGDQYVKARARGGTTVSFEGLNESGGPVLIKVTMKKDDGSYYSLYYNVTVKTLYAITVVNDGNGTAGANLGRAAEGDTVTLTAKPDEGYAFDKWVTVPEDLEIEDDKFAMPANAVTVTATFKKKPAPKTATLTFDLAGGTLDGQAGKVTVEAKVGDTVKLPAAPTRDGYTFKCWKGSEYAAGAEYKVEGDHEFTAEWEKAPAATYTVAYDANGGAGTMGKQTAEAGATVTLTANAFTRDGYTFAGWNTAKDGSGTSYKDKAEVKLEGDMTLYAQWAKKAAAKSSARTGDTVVPVAAVAVIAVIAAGALVVARRKMG